MSDTEGIILGISLSIGITCTVFLLSYVSYKIGVKYRDRHGELCWSNDLKLLIVNINSHI